MTLNIVIVILICFICFNMWGQVNLMMLVLKSGLQIAAKVDNPAGITEYRQGQPLNDQNNPRRTLHCGSFPGLPVVY